MISLDMKSETKTSSSSPLNLSTPSDEPKLSFSELLKGVSEKKDGKVIQNGSLILSLAADEKEVKDTKSISKGDALLALLKNEDTLVDKKEQPLELHPKITANLTTKEIKTLVAEAKNYLKDKIQESDGFKKLQIKELPKTLKGLVEVAKKIGVDITKITVEEVKSYAEVKSAKNLIKQEDIKTITANDDDKKQPREVKVQNTTTEQDVDIKLVPEKKIAVQDLKEVAKDKKVSTQDVKEVVQDKKVPTQDVKEVVQDKKLAVQEPKEIKTNTAKTAPLSQPEQLREIQRDEKISKIPNEIKATPLFKAQSAVEHTTTEQIVQVKSSTLSKVEQKTPKDKADETLKLLLRGEKPSIGNTALTADFSVATAKVIAPEATTDLSKSLETLLHGESSSENGASSIKAETLTTLKADSFEVKLNEAKQMIKYLSNDVKTAIEDYKSPFTRVKVQLNPQKLGEVDLTIVQRGKNLHVNISSNNTAVNTLAMNANELKVQLSNSGINNATLNFSNNSQNGENAQQQQQNHQKHKEAHEEYGALRKFENEEANEEILSSLEIIVPQYG